MTIPPIPRPTLCDDRGDMLMPEPPPLIDVRLCLNVALAFLPLWLATVVRGWLAVLLTIGVASWAKFVLEPALTEPDPGGEF